MTDVAINDVLASLGLTRVDAATARSILEEEGITNPRKARLAVAKTDRARAAIDGKLARLCHACQGRVGLEGREFVQVRPETCSNCGGSRNARALEELVGA